MPLSIYNLTNNSWKADRITNSAITSPLRLKALPLPPTPDFSTLRVRKVVLRPTGAPLGDAALSQTVGVKVEHKCTAGDLVLAAEAQLGVSEGEQFIAARLVNHPSKTVILEPDAEIKEYEFDQQAITLYKVRSEAMLTAALGLSV